MSDKTQNYSYYQKLVPSKKYQIMLPVKRLPKHAIEAIKGSETLARLVCYPLGNL
jgi:hypothetical protein